MFYEKTTMPLLSETNYVNGFEFALVSRVLLDYVAKTRPLKGTGLSFFDVSVLVAFFEIYSKTNVSNVALWKNTDFGLFPLYFVKGLNEKTVIVSNNSCINPFQEAIPWFQTNVKSFFNELFAFMRGKPSFFRTFFLLDQKGYEKTNLYHAFAAMSEKEALRTFCLFASLSCNYFSRRRIEAQQKKDPETYLTLFPWFYKQEDEHITVFSDKNKLIARENFLKLLSSLESEKTLLFLPEREYSLKESFLAELDFTKTERKKRLKGEKYTFSKQEQERMIEEWKNYKKYGDTKYLEIMKNIHIPIRKTEPCPTYILFDEKETFANPDFEVLFYLEDEKETREIFSRD